MSISRYSFLDFPERLNGAHRVLPYALLLSVTFALYATTAYYDFVWDDVGYIHTNYRIHGLSWTHLYAFWTGTYLGHYAPVQHTFLAVLYHFYGLDPFGYHVAQVLVHAASLCLLYLVLVKMEAPRVALLAALLFAVHPTNIETVAWVSESKSTLAFFFFLLSFLFFIRLRERERWTDGVLSGLFLVLSVLSKINTVVAPAIFLLYDYRQGASLKTLRWRSLGALFLISLAFTGIHLGAFHGSPQNLENVYYGGPGLHLMNFPLLLSFYVQMALVPHPLSAWQMFPVQQQFNWLVGIGWAGLAGTAWLLSRASRNLQFWVLWFVVFLLPVLQIVPFPIWVADRYLYVPLVGACVLISRVLFGAWQKMPLPRQRWALEFAAVAVVLVLAVRTRDHLPIWRNDLALWAATTPTCMNSTYCRTNLGLALLREGQTEAGINQLIRAVELRASPQSLERLGDAYTLSARDFKQAAVAYSLALEKVGDYPGTELYGKLARVRILEGNFAEARRMVESGKRVNPNDPALWVIGGILYWKLGEFEEARSYLLRALAMTGRNSHVAEFIHHSWPYPEDVGKLLSDLRSVQSAH